MDHCQRFFQLAVECDALRFGEYTLKSGRTSPYFFNAGAFHSGATLKVLGDCYAQALVESGLAFDMLFGPAYKGIPLVAGLATAMVGYGLDVPFAYDRKEAKDHGEGGRLVGAQLRGKVVIVDDVISAGTSVRAAAGWIQELGAEVAGVLIALDRQERGTGEASASQELQQSLGVPVVSIARLDDLVKWVARQPDFAQWRGAVEQYRADYGVTG